MTHPSLEAAVNRRLATLSQPDIRPAGAVCMTCAGTGTIVTRYSGPDGMFPDEDDCPRCTGTGQTALPSNNTAAEAA